MTNTEAITKLTNIMHDDHYSWHSSILTAFGMAVDALRGAEGDHISRAAAIDRAVSIPMFGRDVKMVAVSEIKNLPSAQPERRCVNCGRTANNGGWYEDGRTRCPIEEHYALPKDGYCHLWEKRKDWEDDYVKRAEEGER